MKRKRRKRLSGDSSATHAEAKGGESTGKTASKSTVSQDVASESGPTTQIWSRLWLRVGSETLQRLTVLAVIVAVSWFLAAITLAGRRHLVLGYSTIVFDTPGMDPFFSTNAAFAFSLVLASVWFWIWRSEAKIAKQTSWVDTSPLVLLGLASLPLWLNLARAAGVVTAPASYFEVLIFAAFTGLSFARITIHWDWVRHVGAKPVSIGLTLIVAMAGLWWYAQSVWYFEHFMLGFNDFGHFTQRVANTAAGRGFLLETPVLPTFWDHFNPMLAALVPLWLLAPTVHWVFAIQALCLAGSSMLIWAVARSAGQTHLQAALWAIAWLAQPAIGQMNLAFTYGWHPISIAIPLLLATLWMLQHRRWTVATICCVAAMLVEEGVIVVVGCFCFACLIAIFLKRFSSEQRPLATTTVMSLTFRTWAICFLISVVSFAVVYRFSGIAEFQTGRFVALGANAWEVVLSPIVNPTAFWGQLLLPRKFAYLLSITLPCFLPTLVRGWRFAIACFLPFLVLLVWDHFPATCLSFQYASALLPVLWFASIDGAKGKLNPDDQESGSQKGTMAAQGALATGLTLSIFVGQMPFSVPSMLDAYSATYGKDMYDPRNPNLEVTIWLNERIGEIRDDGGEVLATSRIASHLVGNRDVETVGQYSERRPDLAKLPDRAGNPLGHYRWIVLDRLETFQQTPQQIESVYQEAISRGFEVVGQRDEILVLRQRER